MPQANNEKHLNHLTFAQWYSCYVCVSVHMIPMVSYNIFGYFSSSVSFKPSEKGIAHVQLKHKRLEINSALQQTSVLGVCVCLCEPHSTHESLDS